MPITMPSSFNCFGGGSNRHDNSDHFSNLSEESCPRPPPNSPSGPQALPRPMADIHGVTRPPTPYPYTDPHDWIANCPYRDPSGPSYGYPMVDQVGDIGYRYTDPFPDAGDESLQRYKESLGLGGGGKDLSDPNDPRVCIIDSLTMESPGRDPVTIDLSTAGSEETLKDKPFKIKEGAKFTMVANFRVQHEILSGLQYVQVVKRKGIRVSKDTEMLGSFAPNTDKTPSYTKRFQEEDAPSGMIARGHYQALSTFVDDDKKTHLAFEWSFDIAKDW